MDPIDTLQTRADSIKGKRNALLPFWQEIAENFHPLRAQFTRQFYLSEQFTDVLLTSYPLLVARTLKDAFSSMLRPRDQDWFAMTVDHPERLDRTSKAWLQWATGVQRRAMYDRRAQFTRATKEGDGDFAAFGNAVLTKEVDVNTSTLLYRSWHLKDTVWAEGVDGSIGEIYRWWNPSGLDLKKRFPKTYSRNIEQWVDKDPHREVRCLHVVIPGEDYDRIPLQGSGDKLPKFRTPWASIYIDLENKNVLEETASHSKIYTIPRWETVSGSPWAYSPAAVAGLPDGRLLQAMTMTLMEAGEMTVRPPLIATQEVVKGDLALYAGGVTWIDAEYDERLGEALRPLVTTTGGIPIGMDMLKDAREMLAQAFYTNKLGLPPPDREMTAYETGQRLQEWIRDAMPLFEPVEAEYNAALCEDTFEELMRRNAFGPWSSIPQPLRRQEVHFSFESPLHQATERKKGALLLQAGQLITQAAQLDPDCGAQVNAVTALRDALEGIGTPENWLRDPAQAAQIVAARQQQQQQALQTQQVANAGQAAESMGRAVQSFQGAAG